MAVINASPAPVRPEPEMDQYGRYVIPDPRTGKRRSWTRATTYAKSIADQEGLTRWKIRMAVLGVARRQDLYAAAATIADPDDDRQKKKLDGICKDAMEYAGAHQKATLGSALHTFVEYRDVGREHEVPPPWDQDVKAYGQAIEQAGIEVSPRYVERIAVLPDLGVAGTFDRVVRYGGRLMIMDVKTGSDLTFGITEFAIQLAIYAHAPYLYDIEERRHFPMPAVDKDQALIAHLPSGLGTCTLHVVDIHAGWRTAHLCTMVRDWRKRRDLSQTLETITAVEANGRG